MVFCLVAVFGMATSSADVLRLAPRHSRQNLIWRNLIIVTQITFSCLTTVYWPLKIENILTMMHAPLRRVLYSPPIHLTGNRRKSTDDQPSHQMDFIQDTVPEGAKAPEYGSSGTITPNR